MKFISTLTALALAGTGALAQGIEASRVTGEYDFRDLGEDLSISFATATADVSYLLGRQYGLQVGIAGSTQLSASQDDLDVDTAYGLAVHGFYDISPDIRAGLMLATESRGETEQIAALEGVFTNGLIRAEGRVGTYLSDTISASMFELHGAYAVTRDIAARGSYQRINYDDDAGAYAVLSVGGSYSFADNIMVYGSVGRMTDDLGGGTMDDAFEVSAGLELSLTGPRRETLFTYSPFF